MEEYLWYKVLHYWCYTKQPNGSGLTIPFLIGVEKKYGRGEGYKIDDLLIEFHSIEGAFSITIRNCQYINMDVCCLDILSEKEKSYTQNFGSIYLEVIDYEEFKTFSDFKLIIIAEYISYIEQNNYSINNGTWSDFTAHDLELIDNII